MLKLLITVPYTLEIHKLSKRFAIQTLLWSLEFVIQTILGRSPISKGLRFWAAIISVLEKPQFLGMVSIEWISVGNYLTH